MSEAARAMFSRRCRVIGLRGSTGCHVVGRSASATKVPARGAPRKVEYCRNKKTSPADIADGVFLPRHLATSPPRHLATSPPRHLATSLPRYATFAIGGEISSTAPGPPPPISVRRFVVFQATSNSSLGSSRLDAIASSMSTLARPRFERPAREARNGHPRRRRLRPPFARHSILSKRAKGRSAASFVFA